jgi:hypothetical protein
VARGILALGVAWSGFNGNSGLGGVKAQEVSKLSGSVTITSQVPVFDVYWHCKVYPVLKIFLLLLSRLLDVYQI